MWQDPIVEEIRQLRQPYSAQFNHDLKTSAETCAKDKRRMIVRLSHYRLDPHGKL